ncbi:SiaB family protein kinase [Magnetospira thiophila]
MSIRKTLKNKEIWFLFEGFLTEDILSGTSNALKMRLSCDDVAPAVAKITFHVFVELAQNIMRYSDKHEFIESLWGAEDLKFGTIVVGRGKDTIVVASENQIQNEKVESLRSHLDTICGLDAEGRKKLYKETLRGNTPEQSKGAAVGFIDIARNRLTSFNYVFYEIDDSYSRFVFEINIDTSGTAPQAL